MREREAFRDTTNIKKYANPKTQIIFGVLSDWSVNEGEGDF